MGKCVVKYRAAELLKLVDPIIVIQPELKAALGRLRLLRKAGWSRKTCRLRGSRKRCMRRQKRGKRAGLLARLRANNRPAFPSLFLANVRSLDNKMDLLRLRMSYYKDMKNCCVYILTETWLDNNKPDVAYQIDGLLLFRADRNHLSGKTCGGGLCAYINRRWCTNCSLVSSHCSEAVEYLTLKCRPYYLPREYTVVFMVAVYIPPSANAGEALRELHDHIWALQNRHPEAFFVIAGDFNHVKLTDTLPRFYQHVSIATRGNNTLDRVYTNRRDSYRAVPRPHLGFSDHVSIMLVPAHHPVLKAGKPTQKTITVWPSDAASILQDCFERTNWQIFREAATDSGEVDLEEYASSVSGYISKCIDDVTTTRTVTIHPNQKPWLNGEVRSLLKARDSAYRLGDAPALRAARRELDAGIKRAKANYALKIQGHFSTNDPRSMWKGIKTITEYSRGDAACPCDPSLPDALNTFYARFEASNTSPSSRLPLPPGELPLSVTAEDVGRTLLRVNPRKAAGPDNIPGRVLRDCAQELTGVLTDIFNTSLSQALVPTCFKTATIIPVPKNSAVSGMNDYRPVALTPTIMKCFERLVMVHIKDSVDINVDPHQYAYRKNRSTSDAVSSVLHLALTHLETRGSYVRLLFLDFSSAFNTIIPQTLVNKLLLLGVKPSLCNWILDFLTNRPQTVKIHDVTSSSITLNTGSPQGCVLSPLLYTLLTYDCSARHPSSHIVKFADDTVVMGLISHNDESEYRQEVVQLEDWCKANNLCINVGKTKEVIVDFRRGNYTPPSILEEQLWRWSPVSSTWGCTSLRTSAGPATLPVSERKPTNAYTF